MYRNVKGWLGTPSQSWCQRQWRWSCLLTTVYMWKREVNHSECTRCGGKTYQDNIYTTGFIVPSRLPERHHLTQLLQIISGNKEGHRYFTCGYTTWSMVHRTLTCSNCLDVIITVCVYIIYICGVWCDIENLYFGSCTVWIIQFIGLWAIICCKQKTRGINNYWKTT